MLEQIGVDVQGAVQELRSLAHGISPPLLAERGVDEALYDNVAAPEAGGYSAQELLAIEYAEKFALDHRSLDDAFFDRMKAEFSDAEILELTAMIGDWLAFGRLNAVLDISEACAWSPRASV